MNEEPKMLPPALRPKKRYIVFEVVSENPIQYNELVSAVWNSMLSMFGEDGASDSNLWFVKGLYDEKGQRGLIKCSHNYVEQVRVALSMIQIVSESKAIVKILGVTGTIKSAQRKYLSSVNLKTFAKE